MSVKMQERRDLDDYTALGFAPDIEINLETIDKPFALYCIDPNILERWRLDSAHAKVSTYRVDKDKYHQYLMDTDRSFLRLPSASDTTVSLYIMDSIPVIREFYVGRYFLFLHDMFGYPVIKYNDRLFLRLASRLSVMEFASSTVYLKWKQGNPTLT